MGNEILDCLVIGGSAAGVTAGIYLARRGVNFKLVTETWGGEVATSGIIENWPGVEQITGVELADNFRKHLAVYGVEIEEEVRVQDIKKQEGIFLVQGEYRRQPIKYQALTVILATGVHPRKLGVPGEEEYYHKGLSYCTVCDGPLFKAKTTVTIGGGNSALESALMLSAIAKKVYVLNIHSRFKGDEVLIQKVKKAENVEIIYNAQTTKVLGEQLVTGVEYKDKTSGQIRTLQADGIFVHIGMLPNSDLVGEDLVEKNDYGEIKVDHLAHTKTPGLYAAGDVTFIPHKQIVIAAGQGAIAALEAVNFLNKLVKSS